MQNLPFGEPFIDQRATSYDTRYKFTGKEMDSETGYQFPIAIGIGARYYNSDISVWLSVDPLADKYPSMSSYMYTAGNPVMLVDPDGRETIKMDDTWEVDWDNKTVEHVDNQGGDNVQYVNDNEYGNQTSKEAFIEGYKRDGFTVNDNTGSGSSNSSQNSSTTSNSTNASSNNNSENSNQTSTQSNEQSANFIPYVNPILGISSESLFSKNFNTWMGKDFKFRSQNWGGNGVTGGKFKFAKTNGRYFRWAGTVAGLYGVYEIESQYRSGAINQSQRAVEQISNGIGFIPLYGTAWSFGWNLGKDFGPSTWYGNNNSWFK
jgi:RHS repeat-associated protein